MKMSKLEEYGKNNFAEGFKILLDTDLKTIAVLFVHNLRKIARFCQLAKINKISRTI